MDSVQRDKAIVCILLFFKPKEASESGLFQRGLLSFLIYPKDGTARRQVTSVISTLERLWQEDCQELEASLGYTVRPSRPTASSAPNRRSIPWTYLSSPGSSVVGEG